MSGAAQAGNYSPITLGVGGGVGYLHASQPGVDAGETVFVTQATARLKALWFLGLDWSINLAGDPNQENPTGDEVRFAAKMRLTTLLYAVPTKLVGFYVGMGVGGANIRELASFTAEGNSYHGGVGLEVNVSSRVSIDASFYMIVPGVKSVQRFAERQAALTIEGDGFDGGLNGQSTTTLESATVGDFISLENYELMIRMLVFL